MNVRRLEVENIRSFKNLNLDLSKNINVIAGTNNAGKSTVLKSIYLLQEPFAFAQHDLRIGTTSSAVKIILENVSRQDALMFQNHEKQASHLPTLSNIEVLFPRTAPISGDSYYAETQTIYDHRLTELSLQQRRDRYPFKFGGFPTSEDKGNFIYPFFAKRRSGFLSHSTKNDAYYVSDDFRNLPSKVQKAINQRVTKERFAELCKSILGFEVGVFQGEHGEHKIALHVGYRHHIPMESMGEGTANILGLITLLLTENNKLFLLEELENDIHPQALKKLLDLIIEKSENNQFVISTHSHIILKHLGARPNTKIFFTDWSFENNEDVPTSAIEEVSSSSEKRLQILEKLGYELLDYDLYKGYLIFEESSAEKIVRDFLIPNFIPQLNGKVRTIASQGVQDIPLKFRTLNTLFMYLHRNEIYKNKAWVIVDGDSDGTKIIADLKQKYQTWNKSHFLNLEQHAFEMYYPDLFKKKIATAFNESDRQKRQAAKITLFQEVWRWIEDNPADAKNAFEKSAAEVINKLRLISESM